MKLSSEQKKEFLARAAALGHDPVALEAKGAHDSVKQVTTLDGLRALLAPDTKRSPVTAGIGAAAAAARPAAGGQPLGLLHLTAEQLESVLHSLPMEVRTMSIQDKTLAPNEVWDLGTSSSPVVVNVGTLTMKKGSRIVLRNTALSFTCQKLIRES